MKMLKNLENLKKNGELLGLSNLTFIPKNSVRYDAGNGFVTEDIATFKKKYETKITQLKLEMF
ncbi:hypothetical protein EXT42_04295 [Pseudoalteromonas sp. CO302Y]|uniref:hypothetical protein n=1 Tax=unclassified Pseudoalteromonas TaxID=194690 RepID=UPI001023C6C8|nr:hypothetical protein EXT42_04295 [Pseudoalteromonas sp. CO302Y]RZG10631.1 hypothetical protein EXT40_04295 [Pseudoalteromonas sp. CO133X]